MAITLYNLLKKTFAIYSKKPLQFAQKTPYKTGNRMLAISGVDPLQKSLVIVHKTSWLGKILNADHSQLRFC